MILRGTPNGVSGSARTLALFALPFVLVQQGHALTLSARPQVQTYWSSGLVTENWTSTTGVQIDVSQEIDASHALSFGYLWAHDPTVNRTRYQGFRVLVHRTLMGQNAPFAQQIGLHHVRYFPGLRVRALAGASIGRYLIKSFGEANALDVSSDTAGLVAGLGVQQPLLGQESTQGQLLLAADLTAEYAVNYGPIPSSLVAPSLQIGLAYWFRS